MFPLLLAALLLQTPPEVPGPATPSTPPAAPTSPKPVAPARPSRRAAPQPGPAPAASALPAPPRAAGPLQGDWPAEPSGRRVTLDETITVDDALERIAKAAGWNVVLNTGRGGNAQLVLRLREVPVEEALRAALGGTGLAATRRGDTVVVAPDTGRPEKQPVLSGFDRPLGKRFTGEFDGEEVGSALRKIAKAAGLSIVAPPDLDDEVSGVFNDAPIEDALTAVLSQAGLVAERQGGVIMVQRQRPPRIPGPPGDLSRLGDRLRRDADRAQRETDRARRDLDEGPEEKGKDRVSHGDVVVRVGEHARDVVAIRGDVRLEPGSSARSVVAILGTVRLGPGAQAREATAILGDVELGPGAQVEKDATSVGGHVRADPGADIGGETNSISLPEVSGLGAFRGGWLFDHPSSPIWLAGQILAKFALYFALGLLLLALFPRRVEGVASAMLASPVKSVLTGLLGVLATPLLCLLLIVTVIGIPLVAVVALLILAAGVLGFTALAWHIGRSLPLAVARNTWVLQLAIGTAIVVVLTQVPLLGGLAWVAAALLTFGATLRSRFGQHGPILPTTPVAQPPPAAP